MIVNIGPLVGQVDHTRKWVKHWIRPPRNVLVRRVREDIGVGDGRQQHLETNQKVLQIARHVKVAELHRGGDEGFGDDAQMDQHG